MENSRLFEHKACSGSKLTTSRWTGGSEWGGDSGDCWGYSGGSCSVGGDCGGLGGDDGGGGGCGDAMIRLGYVNLVFKVISLLVNLLLLGSTGSFAVFLLLYGIGWFLSIYFIAVVRWYIEELNEQTENDGPEPPGGESTIEFQSSSLGFPRSSDNQRPKSNVITRLAYVNLAFKVISLLVNLLLLGSTCSGEKRLAYPWLGWSMFELFFDFGVIVFFIVVWNGFAVFFIPYGIGWLLSIYFIVVVYSYIEDNRPENNISPSSGFSSSSDRRRPISNDFSDSVLGSLCNPFGIATVISSSLPTGRLAIVVAADIAVYAAGNARSTGGAGAIAMLVGPNAPLVMEPGMRSVHMQHVYDFYKPNMSSEYPVVDGKLSVQCYFNALDQCYKRYKEKGKQFCRKVSFTLDDIDYAVFHTPFCRIVQKSLARLMFQDFVSDFGCERSLGEKFADLAKFSQSLEELAGKRVMLFSYGSGLASAMFSFRISDDFGPSSPLNTLITSLKDIPARLESRKEVEPAEFLETLKTREHTHNKNSYTPIGSKEDLFPGTYYLVYVDEKFRRTYQRKDSSSSEGNCMVV
ncbi:Hydroxymethylglutaryl-CoA synthase, mitochondrial [Stylophora pistillata]|uniref:Hydroxymethylglutaryl-CoA synthase, mitochondrial n=1 Tax=Stylophora pistillata TaxID=50429 RepID=A0A2B4RPK8_STYPI|nr:Hydroxymethylglutaryl-CoA synthase, mitochondrial [Stylophora pistillata]